jgi:hypothetical protein
MKQANTSKFFRLVLIVVAAVSLGASQVTFARGYNPTVSNSFFLMMDAVAGDCSSQAAQITPVMGSLNSVNWQQAACLIAAMAADGAHPPMVIEVSTSDMQQCDLYKNDPQAGSDICQRQLTESNAAAQARPGVLFLSVDAAQNSSVTGGVDVRVLPTHIFITSYSGVSHYQAMTVMGYMDGVALTAAVENIFNLVP